MEKVPPFFKNVRKEITKSPVYYFVDIGLRNYAAGCFGHLVNPAEKGFVFQNLVLHILKEKTALSNAAIRFWRTKDKSEVDFVIDRGTELIPVEVKNRHFTEPKIERSFRNFIEEYRPSTAYVVTPAARFSIRVNTTTVEFIPLWQLPFIDRF